MADWIFELADEWTNEWKIAYKINFFEEKSNYIEPFITFTSSQENQNWNDGQNPAKSGDGFRVLIILKVSQGFSFKNGSDESYCIRQVNLMDKVKMKIRA